MSKTTSTGTTVSVEEHHGEQIVILDSPTAPAAMRNAPAGRIYENCFQPAPFAVWAISPETLRAIADLIEETR